MWWSTGYTSATFSGLTWGRGWARLRHAMSRNRTQRKASAPRAPRSNVSIRFTQAELAGLREGARQESEKAGVVIKYTWIVVREVQKYLKGKGLLK